MGWTKKITVGYYNIESDEEDFFSNFHGSMETILSSEHRTGMFEAGQLKYAWKLLESIDAKNTAAYFFSVVKERASWPVWVHDDGETSEITLPNGMLGEIYYGLISHAYKFLLCFATGSGSAAAGFKKTLGQFTSEGLIRLTPLFEEGIEEKVMSWDSFKRLAVGVSLAGEDDLSAFSASRAGGLMKMAEYLGGLKVDITVSSGSGKENLSNMIVKDLLPELIANDLCKSLTVKGCDFEDAVMEQFDLKNAQIKYNEQIETEGNYITESDAKQTLMRALKARGNILFRPSS
ncbi:MAG: hypothetical protein LBH05_06215 [Deferribacteraceae bacterium]|jgi:hypothetical protein|nr:hypothetical protein [Deferribacteraceae bacterium]